MQQYIHGKNVVERRLIEHKEIRQIFTVKGTNDNLVKMAKRQDVRVNFVSKKDLDKLVNDKHQNIVAEIAFYQTYDLASLLKNENDNQLLVMLDGIKDPHNFGAILRSGAAVGVDGVIVRKDRSAPLNATVAKASAGAIDVVKVAPVVNLARTIDELKEEGYWVVGTGMDQSEDYRKINYKGKILLVMGSEGEGMSRLVKEKCDFIASIPMSNELESLNVSVATALILYEAYNQKNPIK